MNDLTHADRENIAAWVARNQPELIGYRDRIRVATFPQPERTYTAYDLDTERQHRAELGTHAPGPPLNLTTRSQRRQVYGELVAFTVIGAGALIGFGILAWAVFSIVRQAVG